MPCISDKIYVQNVDILMFFISLIKSNNRAHHWVFSCAFVRGFTLSWTRFFLVRFCYFFLHFRLVFIVSLSHLFALYSDASISFIVHIYLLQRRESSKYHIIFFVELVCVIRYHHIINAIQMHTMLYASNFWQT